MKKLLSLFLVSLALTVCASAQVAVGTPCTINNPGSGTPLVTYAGILYWCNDSTLLWSQFFPSPALSVSDAALQANTGFGSSPQRIAHAQYSFAVDGGAVGTITPAHNFSLPANAVITNVVINSTTAVTSGGSATVALGTTAGSTASAFVAATAKASFSINAFVQGVPVPQTSSTFVKMSAAGQLQVTVATAALTAGVIEVYVFYYVSGT
jgi:hypothetical protein